MSSPLMCDHCLRKTPHVVSLLAACSRRIGNGAGQEKCPVSVRKRSIVMTQTHAKTPRADPFQKDREVFPVAPPRSSQPACSAEGADGPPSHLERCSPIYT